MKAIRRVAIGLAILVACFLVWCMVDFFRRHVDDYSGKTYDEFVAKAGRDFRLPRSARDIRRVASSVSIGGRAHVLRFAAPVADCRSYAIADFRRYDLPASGASAPEFVPMYGRPAIPTILEEGYGIRGLSWFDVKKVEEGITLKRDHDHRPFTWIDTRRGILYSFWTD